MKLFRIYDAIEKRYVEDNKLTKHGDDLLYSIDCNGILYESIMNLYDGCFNILDPKRYVIEWINK